MKKVVYERNIRRPKGSPRLFELSVGQIIAETEDQYRILDSETGNKAWCLKRRTKPYEYYKATVAVKKLTVMVCVDCESQEVHRIEFRTDGGATARTLDALNEGVEDITNDDLPKYLDGYYCHTCRSFSSVKEVPKG